jgi:hypothetical protein
VRQHHGVLVNHGRPSIKARTDRQEASLIRPNKQTQAEAESKFKRKQGQAREATQAMADYESAAVATREKTARLRKLREAKEAADAKAAAEAPPEAEKPPAKKKGK